MDQIQAVHQAKKVRFCTPFLDEKTGYEWAQATLQGLDDSDKYTFHERFVMGSCLIQLRNAFITDYTDKILDYDFFLMWDSDQYCEPEVIYTLLDHDKDIITAPIPVQGMPELYNVGEFIPSKCICNRYGLNERGLKKVPYAGDGGMLIKRKVFETILKEKKSLVFWDGYRFIADDGIERRATHDFGFAELVKSLGFDIWCDFDLKVNHRQKNCN